MKLQFLENKNAINEMIRFLGVGLSCTVVTYLVYLALLKVIYFQFAYLIAYVFGIVYSYVLNCIFTFKQKLEFKKFVRYPTVYLVQYLASLVILQVMVTKMHMDATLAPLLVIALTVPITFVVAKFILKPMG